MLPFAAHARPPVELARAELVATGDVMMHGPVKAFAARTSTGDDHGGFDLLFADPAPIVAAADFAFANLEFPVAPKTGAPGAPVVFNGPPIVLDALAATGFDLVNVANNHAYDQGRPGLLETMSQLERAGLAWVGAGQTCDQAHQARLVDVQGIRFAWIGATAVMNVPLNGDPEGPCVAEARPDWILDQAAQARTHGAEIVVASLHWGTEYAAEPDPAQVALAHQLIDGGVDLILGHHPHVLQRIEWVDAADGRRGLVAYSLGNFVSNQAAFYEPGGWSVADGDPRDGVLLRIAVVRRAFGRGRNLVVRTELADPVVEPLWTTNDPVAGIRVRLADPLLHRLDRTIAETRDDAELEPLWAELTDLEARRAEVAAAVGTRWMPPR